MAMERETETDKISVRGIRKARNSGRMAIQVVMIIIHGVSDVSTSSFFGKMFVTFFIFFIFFEEYVLIFPLKTCRLRHYPIICYFLRIKFTTIYKLLFIQISTPRRNFSLYA